MPRLVRSYLLLGCIFGVIRGGPDWYAILFGGSLPTSLDGILRMLIQLLEATIYGVLRAFLWLPSVIVKVGSHGETFQHWLFNGFW
jgi:hypothetical protein